MREKQSFYLGGWVRREDLGGAEGEVEGGVEGGEILIRKYCI